MIKQLERQSKHSFGKSAPSGVAPIRLSGFLVALAVFVLINLALSPVASRDRKFLDRHYFETTGLGRKGTGSWSWWIAKAYAGESVPDVVLLGSSQMGSASFSADAQLQQAKIDCVTKRHTVNLERNLAQLLHHPVSVFNWSMGGEMVSDAYMISQTLIMGKRRPKVVIIGISPRDFMDNSLQYAASTEPFQFFSQFVNLKEMANLAFGDPVCRLNWEINQRLALLRLRNDWSLVSTVGEVQHAAAGLHRGPVLQALCDAGGQVQPGKWYIPANMPYMFVDNTVEYQHRYQNPRPPIYKSELSFFGAFLSSMRAAGIKVMVVGMPTTWPNRALLPEDFWNDYRGAVAGMCSNNQARWVDLSASRRYEIGDYLDTVHMNARGGAKFFKELARMMDEDPEIRSRLTAGFDQARVGDGKTRPLRTHS